MRTLESNTKGKVSNELLLYKMDELRKFMSESVGEYRAFRDRIEGRVSALELSTAAQKIINETNVEPKVDWQKIMLAFIALVSTVVSLAFGLTGKLGL